MLSRPVVRRRAFTLAELIIVMMIIVLLVAILLPALSSARRKAKTVAAQTQLASLASACESYALQFQSNPGYFSDVAISNRSTQKYWRYLSATENMMLSLMGGVVQSGGTTPYTFDGKIIDIDKIGVGATAKSGDTFGSFYSPKPEELGVVTGTATEGAASDNPIPDLVDPNGVPVLYFRRQSGANYVPASYWHDLPSNGQFILFTNTLYLRAAALATPGGDVLDQRNTSVLSYEVAATAVADSFAWMVTNRKLSSTTAGTASSANNTNDVTLGGYVLVSAGEDKIYASKDQVGSTVIDRYEDVDNLDDIIVSGGD